MKFSLNYKKKKIYVINDLYGKIEFKHLIYIECNNDIIKFISLKEIYMKCKLSLM